MSLGAGSNYTSSQKTQQLYRREIPVFWVSGTLFGEGGEATDLNTCLSENLLDYGDFFF